MIVGGIDCGEGDGEDDDCGSCDCWGGDCGDDDCGKDDLGGGVSVGRVIVGG